MRYAILFISSYLFVEFCKHGIDALKVTANALPEDAKCVRMFTDDTIAGGRLGMVLESASFKELKEGDPIPILPDPVFEKEEK